MTRIQREKTNPEAVVATLDAYREVLSSYQIDSDLTHSFRVKVEPQLNEVWSKEDLAKYSYTVWSFGQQIKAVLFAWSQRYCARANVRVTRQRACRIR